ncbi:MAG TPA: hypothetical protein VI757_08665 [Bacteroidia bacterium]|nr:hypothetical protein [Bacteroidia bacterium]
MTILIAGCKEETVVLNNSVSLNYFPTEKGKWIIYDVDSTYYNDFDSSAHRHLFQLMEKIDSAFIDGEGNSTQRILRFKRDTDSSQWSFINVWTQTLTNSNAQRVEENIRFVNLGFPVSSSTTWNRNSYNTLGEEEYDYSDLHSQKTVGNISFDSTLTISFNDFPNNIYDHFVEEIYATKVGLIFRKYINANKNIGSYYRGIVYYQTINSFGN